MARKRKVPGSRSGRQQWIDFLRYSLCDICARGEWDDFGLFRILNRVSFLSQKQLAFIIYHVESGAQVVDKEISTFDPLFQKALFERLTGLQLAVWQEETDDLVINHAVAKDYEITLFDTANRIILFELDVTDREKPGDEPILEFVPVQNTSELGAFYVEVFKPFDGQEGRMKFCEPIEAHFAKLRTAGAYQIASGGRPEDHPLSREDKQLVARAAGTVSNLVSAEHRRLSKSPLLRSFLTGRDGMAQSLTNLFFFSKIFSRETTRYVAYYYDPILMAGADQLQALAEGLEVVERKELIPFGIAKYDKKFWRLRGEPGGISKLINMIRGSWPAHCRLFAENALMSGSSMIKPDIFARKGLVWIASKGLTRDERDEAYMRATCLHYILQLVSPVAPTEARSLSLISMPFRCSGGIWMCASYLRENVSKDHKDDPVEVDGLISQHQFHRNLLIYHSLLRESERRLRTKARNAYIEALAELVSDPFPAKRTSKGIDLKFTREAIDTFNSRAEVLTRVYPFQRISLTHPEGAGGVDIRDLRLRGDPNTFFDRLTLFEFLKEENTAQRLRERIALNAVTSALR